jgi:hypothetical protein
VIIVVAFIYGVGFNFIDSLNYCYNDKNLGYACKSVGDIFGGDLKYQPWNIIGHIIPGLFMLFYFRSKKEELAIVELFLAGILISTATMDSLYGELFAYSTATTCGIVHRVSRLHHTMNLLQDHLLFNS